MTQAIILCILDGWGVSHETEHNAIRLSETPHWDALCREGSYAELEASEHFVGLPDKQIGNSEVGHANIGCGRILDQDFVRINRAIESGEFATNCILQESIKALRESGGVAHVIGLLSEGGVHSHQHHIETLVNILHGAGIRTHVHAITDGRDTSLDSALQSIERFEQACPNALIASVSGRFFAMDRDNNWERTTQAYEAIASAQGEQFTTAQQAIEASYGNEIYDEYIPPSVMAGAQPIGHNDGVFFMNFRSDRIRQLASMILGVEQHSPIKAPQLATTIGLVEYSTKLNQHLRTLFPAQAIKASLGEIIAQANYKQLRIAETEKYNHVTYFFNGNSETIFNGEERIMVPSPKVKSYDSKPEMSAYELTDKLQQAIESQKYNFIVVNFANPDMVGHTGNLSAACEAVSVIDDILGRLTKTTTQQSAVLIVTADHGNVETMFNTRTNKRHTSHTSNPVPFVIWGKNMELRNGSLCDIAPTILELMQLEKPPQMSGQSLIQVSAIV